VASLRRLPVGIRGGRKRSDRWDSLGRQRDRRPGDARTRTRLGDVRDTVRQGRDGRQVLAGRGGGGGGVGGRGFSGHRLQVCRSRRLALSGFRALEPRHSCVAPILVGGQGRRRLVPPLAVSQWETGARAGVRHQSLPNGFGAPRMTLLGPSRKGRRKGSRGRPRPRGGRGPQRAAPVRDITRRGRDQRDARFEHRECAGKCDPISGGFPRARQHRRSVRLGRVPIIGTGRGRQRGTLCEPWRDRRAPAPTPCAPHPSACAQKNTRVSRGRARPELVRQQTPRRRRNFAIWT
jgi:hypothetical protein